MIEAYKYDGSSVRLIPFEEVVFSHEHTEHTTEKYWIDIIHLTEAERDSLKNKFNLHMLTVEDLFSRNVRIKVESFDHYLFCIFYGLMKSKTKVMEPVELDFIIGHNFVITNHWKELPIIEDLQHDEQRLQKLFAKGVEFIFHKILDKETDNIAVVIESFDEAIGHLEKEALTKPSADLVSRILALKQVIVKTRKRVTQQREHLSFLVKGEYHYLSKKSLPFFRDVYDHTIRLNDDLDNYKDAISDTFDVYTSTVSNHMNSIMKTLSIITTIALPLTAISGIYGTNFTFIPGLASPLGFFVMLCAMLGVVALMILYFKRKHWF
jgi:magnesium transporter